MTDNRAKLRLVEHRLSVHIEEEEKKWTELREAQERNTVSIKELTEATKPLVDALVAVNAFHRFIKWASSFAVVGVVIAWASHTWLF